MGEEGEVRRKGHHGGIGGRSKVIVVFVFVCACVCVCVSAGYQLLSGDGSRSRCMAAVWCFMLSRYSCWETASTDARISSSSQSVRPEDTPTAHAVTHPDTLISSELVLNLRVRGIRGY